MRNFHKENIQEHCHRVATIAHNLALVKNKLFGGDLNPDRVAVYALYHDTSEVITGDLPTPVKYFSKGIKSAYKEIEAEASRKLLEMLPTEIRDEYEPILFGDDSDEHWITVKQADKLCAYLKCVEERHTGNKEFLQAEKQLRAAIDAQADPAVSYFLKTFVPSFSLSLDEISY